MGDVDDAREILTITPTESGWVLAGEIDASNTDALTAAFTGQEACGGRAVEVDLGGVTFIDSSGLRCLVELAQRTNLASGTVALVDTPHNVGRLVELAGLEGLFDVRTASRP
jgi:anti-sigma B factor antagonist